jgi:L-alanine-DL-glutamate epimerase-like enolase superfamily enzyme
MKLASARRERIPVRIPMGEGRYEALIVVEHGDGVEGLGEAPLLPGRDREAAIRAAEETARLDLEARQAGVSLAEWLGGIRRRRVECSALINDRRPELVARQVERWAAAGFSCFKLKAANGGGVLDQERLGAARWAAGRAGRLRLDLNGGLTLREASERLPSLAPFRLELVEQPLAAGASASAWAELAARVPMPIAADESLAGQGAELKALGVGLAMKLATVGGPRPALDLARGAPGLVSIGSSHETSIGLAAALHVACALEAEPLACGLATVGLLDADLGRGLDAGQPHLDLPAGPGLGVELDRGALERYRLDR